MNLRRHLFYENGNINEGIHIPLVAYRIINAHQLELVNNLILPQYPIQ